MPTYETTLPPDLWVPPADDTYQPLLRTVDVESHLRAQGLGPKVAVLEGPEVSSDPGALIVVTWTAGAGFSLEHMLDTPGFQLRTVGPQGNREAAGGRPALDRTDAAGRAHYVCTYLADVEAQ